MMMRRTLRGYFFSLFSMKFKRKIIYFFCSEKGQNWRMDELVGVAEEEHQQLISPENCEKLAHKFGVCFSEEDNDDEKVISESSDDESTPEKKMKKKKRKRRRLYKAFNGLLLDHVQKMTLCAMTGVPWYEEEQEKKEEVDENQLDEAPVRTRIIRAEHLRAAKRNKLL